MEKEKQIIQYIEDNGISFYDYVLNYEDEHFKAYLFDVLDSMFTCVQNGLHHEGVIPGRLQLKRVAKSMYQQAINTRRESDRERLLVSSYAANSGHHQGAGRAGDHRDRPRYLRPAVRGTGLPRRRYHPIKCPHKITADRLPAQGK